MVTNARAMIAAIHRAVIVSQKTPIATKNFQIYYHKLSSSNALIYDTYEKMIRQANSPETRKNGS